MGKNNLNQDGQCVIPDVSSTVIELINCELSEDMKAHIEMLGRTKNAFDNYAPKALMVPKEMFGRK